MVGPYNIIIINAIIPSKMQELMMDFAFFVLQVAAEKPMDLCIVCIRLGLHVGESQCLNEPKEHIVKKCGNLRGIHCPFESVY
jgi:hypothetical protein